MANPTRAVMKLDTGWPGEKEFQISEREALFRKHNSKNPAWPKEVIR